MNVKIKGIFVTVTLAIVGLVIGVLLSQHIYFKKKIDSAAFHGTYLENPRAVNPFDLVGMDQKPFNNASLEGHWTLVFFGFTNCGYLCPTTMAEIGKMYRILEEKKIKILPKIVMITVDPDRDTLEKLRHYVTSFHADFFGARGEEPSIKSMAREMGIAYTKVMSKNSEPEDYDIQHSGALMLFNPQGELNAFFTTPHHAELLAKDYMLLVS